MGAQQSITEGPRASDFLAFGAAHRVRRARLVIFGRHLFMTATRRIHIGDVCDFARGRARAALLFAVRTVRRLCAAVLVLGACACARFDRGGDGLGRFGGLARVVLLLVNRVVHNAGDLHEV